MAQPQVVFHELLGERLGSQARVGRHLVVARTAVCRRPPAAPMRRVSSLSMDMWMSSSLMSKVNVPASMSAWMPSSPAQMASRSSSQMMPLRREHGRVRAGAGNVLPVQVPVHGKRRTELLRHLGYRLLKAAAPQRHV